MAQRECFFLHKLIVLYEQQWMEKEMRIICRHSIALIAVEIAIEHKPKKVTLKRTEVIV